MDCGGLVDPQQRGEQGGASRARSGGLVWLLPLVDSFCCLLCSLHSEIWALRASALAVITSNEQWKWSTSRRCKNSITTLTYQLVNWSLSIYFRERPTSHHFIHSMSEVKCWSDRMLKYAIGHCVRRSAKRFFPLGLNVTKQRWTQFRHGNTSFAVFDVRSCAAVGEADPILFIYANLRVLMRMYVQYRHCTEKKQMTRSFSLSVQIKWSHATEYWNDPRDCETSQIRLFTDLHIPR